MNVLGAVLAAGASRRMGTPKQLLPWGGGTLLGHAAAAVCGSRCARVVVIVGHRSDAMRLAIPGTDAEIVVNPDWEEGIASSVRVAVRVASDHAMDGVLLSVCDQPSISPAVLDALLDRFEREPDRVVASAYAGTVGVPAVFGARWYPQLLALTGDAGARRVLRDHPADVTAVPWEDGAEDVDNPEDAAGPGEPA